MKTYNEIITNLSELKRIAEDIVCDKEVIYELSIPYKETKARINAKRYGFTFDWDKKVWVKKSTRCEWVISSYITNIFKN